VTSKEVTTCRNIRTCFMTVRLGRDGYVGWWQGSIATRTRHVHAQRGRTRKCTLQ